MLDFQNN